MTDHEIIAHFGIDSNSILSLKQQLTDRIKAFLDKMPAGTRLPSERILAEKLHVSRLTIRSALKIFHDEGTLISAGRNGTRVTHSLPDLEQLDPMILGIPVQSAQVAELKFLSFENLPFQRQYWTEIAAMYQRQNPGTSITLELLDVKSYRERLSSSDNGDIIHISHDQVNMGDFLQSLPEGFSHPKYTPSFLNGCFPDDPVWQYLVPVELTHRMLLWNRKLADLCGFGSLKAELKKRGIFGLIRAAHEKLPRQYRICGHVWDMIGCSFTPLTHTLPEKLPEYLHELASFPESDRIFYTSQRYSFDMVENFWKGQQLFSGIDSLFLSHMGKLKFPVDTEPYPLPPGQFHMATPLALGISKQCRNPEAAANFLRFLLSKQVQMMLPKWKNRLPLRLKELTEAIPSWYKTLDAAEVEKFRNSLRSPRGEFMQTNLWLRFAIYDIRQEIVQTVLHEIKPEKAIEIIREKWQKYSLAHVHMGDCPANQKVKK